MSFGQFISGKNLGQEITIENLTDEDQTLSLALDNTSARFSESVSELLAPFHPEDLPFSASPGDSEPAANAQQKFKCWSIENPSDKVLSKEILI